MRSFIISFLFLLTFPAILLGETAGKDESQPGRGLVDALGLPFLHVYKSNDIKVNSILLAVVQDKRGVVYAGSEYSLLEFDGANWRNISLPHRSAVVSLGVDRQGTVFVGGTSEFGFLAPDQRGRMRFVPLSDSPPASRIPFSTVSNVITSDDAVYFAAREGLFRWARGRLHAWQPAETFGRAFSAQGGVYVWAKGQGLLKAEGDELHLVPGTEALAETPVRFLLPWKDGLPGDKERLLVGTESAFFLLDGLRLLSFSPEDRTALAGLLLRKALVLPDGEVALTVKGAGVFVGNLRQPGLKIWDKARGLTDEEVSNIGMDREGGVWLSSNDALHRLEYPSPFSVFDGRQGLEGPVRSICRHQGTLYAATTKGLYRLEESRGGARFRSVPHFYNMALIGLISVGDVLLAAGTDGIYEIREEQAKPLFGKMPEMLTWLHRSKNDPARVFVGSTTGKLFAFRKTPGNWVWEGEIPGTRPGIGISFVQTDDGDIWWGTQNSGVFRIVLPPGWPGQPGGQPPRVEHFTEDSGLPDRNNCYVLELEGQVLAGTSGGMYRFDQRTQRFRPDGRFAGLFQDGLGVLRDPVLDFQGRLWAVRSDAPASRNELGLVLRQPDGTYRWEGNPFARLSHLNIWHVFPQPDGLVWISCSNQLIRFTPRLPKPQVKDFAVLIREVGLADDALLFGGAWPQGGQTPREIPALDYGRATVHFDFALPIFERGDANRYQVRLEGYDPGWSAWTALTRKEYTNLPEGDYVFRVRARNVYGRLSREATYRFRVRPPWYRTVWAYAGYALLGGLFVFGLVQVNTARLRKAKTRLEQTVSQRTADLKARTNELQQRTDELQERTGLLHERTEELELLDRVVQAINSETEHNHLLLAMIRQLMDLIPQVEVGVFFALRGEGTGFRAIASLRRGSPDVNPISGVYSLEYFQRCEQLAEIVDENVTITRDGTNVPESPDEGFPQPVPLSTINIRIVVDGQVKGVLTLGSWSDPRAFGRRDAEQLLHLRPHVTSAFLKSKTILELKRALAEADAARREADTANQAKSEFLSCMSHELRTPLNAIIGFSEVLLERHYGDLSDKQEEYVHEVLGGGRHLLSIINDILDMAKIEAGRMDLQLTRFLLGKTVSSTMAMLREKCLNHGVAAVLDCPAELEGLEIEADQRKFKQILFNLISNALKFTERGSVTLAVRQIAGPEGAAAPWVEISVADTGIGLRPEDLTLVFETFYQVGRPLSGKAKGTGLGLPIVKKLVELHGGTIWAESEGEGRGSRFVFRLPTEHPAESASTSR